MAYEYTGRRKLIKNYRFLDEQYIRNFQKITLTSICNDLGFKIPKLNECDPMKLRMIRMEIERRIKCLNKYAERVENGLKECE